MSRRPPPPLGQQATRRTGCGAHATCRGHPHAPGRHPREAPALGGPPGCPSGAQASCAPHSGAQLPYPASAGLATHAQVCPNAARTRAQSRRGPCGVDFSVFSRSPAGLSQPAGRAEACNTQVHWTDLDMGASFWIPSVSTPRQDKPTQAQGLGLAPKTAPPPSIQRPSPPTAREQCGRGQQGGGWADACHVPQAPAMPP